MARSCHVRFSLFSSTKANANPVSLAMWGIAFVFLAAVLLSIVVLFSSTQRNIIDTSEVEALTFCHVFLHSPRLLYYDEDIARYHPDTLDMSRFDSSSLATLAFADSTETPGVQLQVRNRLTGDDTTIYWQQSFYERLSVRRGFLGLGASRHHSCERPLLLKTDDGLVPGWLIVDVYVPKKYFFRGGAA